jgi:UDP-N-acetylmuramoylalanine--D-glutamate ligase
MLERLGALRFDAAAMLNLSPDHIDRHGDIAEYAAAKRQIFARQTADDFSVVGIDDELSRAMADSLRGGPARLVTITSAADIARSDTLPGSHNAQNAAAATALATALGVPPAAIAEGLKTYPGLPHRQEHVRRVGGVDFINDSKATNADSVARALACYDRVVWIAGGMAKEGGIDSLAPFFPRVATAFLIGRDAGILAGTLAAHGVKHRDVGTLEAAVAEAWTAARDGAAPVVLLSPACASWDQFTGFEQRGDVFKKRVMEIAA